MHVFVTGASGFIGSAVVRELRAAGHGVVGLARSDASAAALTQAGAEVVRGDLTRPETLAPGVARADAVIHLAFDHDFSKLADNCANEQRAIEALGDALVGTSKLLVVTSGTGLVSAAGRPSTEDDAPRPGGAFPRVPERAAEAVAQRGVRVAIVRLPQVHDTRRAGLVSFVIEVARQKGFVGYVGEGTNHWSAAHVTDVARLYRLAVEKGDAARYHAVGEEGVRLRAIADVVGKGLGLPVRSIPPAEAPGYFGWMAHLATEDLRSSSDKTRAALGWEPKGPGLIEDLAKLEWV
ncbi:SDR family oxidoreductase [Sorangium sp. So ce291]|uniref:SDR family oxidoreductase n=1 Tax=Sorangium sp. So ce291 TaxID=3133294 RepID=UPI003F6243B5